MPNLNLTIAGRTYTVSAAADEQDHIAMLGRMIDERVRRAGSGSGQSETRILLIAALMLADELHEEHRKEPPPAPAPAPAAMPAPEPEPESAPGEAARAAVLARIEGLAARIEKLARHLEEPRTSA